MKLSTDERLEIFEKINIENSERIEKMEKKLQKMKREIDILKRIGNKTCEACKEEYPIQKFAGTSWCYECRVKYTINEESKMVQTPEEKERLLRKACMK